MSTISSRSRPVSAVRRKVEEIIQCAICLEAPTSPKLLPCMHLFCLPCLTNTHLSATDCGQCESSDIRCPSCRQLYRIPQGGLAAFPTDYRANELKDLLKQLSLYTSPGDTGKAAAQAKTLDKDTVEVLSEYFHQLIKRKALSEAEAFLREWSTTDRKNIAAAQVRGRTALHLAVQKGGDTLAQCLVEECEADTEQLSKYTDTETKEVSKARPLWLAAVGNNVKMVETLLSLGAKVNGATDTGSTPLRAACYRANLPMVQLLVGRRAEVNTPKSSDGSTCLMMTACQDKTGDICRFLINSGAHVNAQSKDGWTALHYTCEQGRLATARLLLEKGAKVELSNAKAHSPLHFAAQEGFVDIVKLLVSHGADVELRNAEGHAALYCAINDGPHIETAEYLLSADASPNSVDNKRKRTALHRAVEHGSEKAVSLLLKHGADMYTRDARKRDALWLAVVTKHEKIVQLLIEKHQEDETEENA